MLVMSRAFLPVLGLPLQELEVKVLIFDPILQPVLLLWVWEKLNIIVQSIPSSTLADLLFQETEMFLTVLNSSQSLITSKFSPIGSLGTEYNIFGRLARLPIFNDLAEILGRTSYWNLEMTRITRSAAFSFQILTSRSFEHAGFLVAFLAVEGWRSGRPLVLDCHRSVSAAVTLNLADSAFRLEHNAKWFQRAAGVVALEPNLSSRENTPADDIPTGNVDQEQVAGACLVITTTIYCGRFGFRIDFPNHAGHSAHYVENLQAFADKLKATAEKGIVDHPNFDALGLGTAPTTLAPSEAATPRERPIYYDIAQIGVGTFGRVSKTIKARDGKAFASKVFIPPPNKNKRRRDDSDSKWLIGIRREFAIMRDNPHANIVQVLELRETPEPAVIMRYYPLGNIDNADMLGDELVTAWGQILDGLRHLHAKGVAHRDLKPANILVERDPLVRVVIADFGLAKIAPADELLSTFCGSHKYAAPEVFPGRDGCDGHGPLVDIWSLGIMVYEWLYGIIDLPELPTGDFAWSMWSKLWAVCVRTSLDDEDDDDAIDILNHMVEVKVTLRWRAEQCLMQGLNCRLFVRRKADGLVAYGGLPHVQEGPATLAKTSGTRPPSVTRTFKPSARLERSQDTIVEGSLWNGEQETNSDTALYAQLTEHLVHLKDVV
ncbi:hypothetical protein B0A48_18759 [Cryoendolithus antarcticus]|uniref:Protein kinase domain-containing protein n=1 Tax=Cryoendolithus antarcticus TaxID=1507870 RepID=A0A1V8S7F3_9PEZI|nr:hypothetical protein B0A48_18759 [Cryoendolithus antarcticus]